VTTAQPRKFFVQKNFVNKEFPRKIKTSLQEEVFMLLYLMHRTKVVLIASRKVPHGEKSDAGNG
jgi:hypothetical protein